MKLLRIAVLVLLAFFVGSSALHAQTVDGWGHRVHYSSNGFFMPMMPWEASTSGWTGLGAMGIVLMFAWWIFIVGLIAFFLRWIMGRKSDGVMRSHNTALDILRERYARGEINKAEFEEKLKDLS